MNVVYNEKKNYKDKLASRNKRIIGISIALLLVSFFISMNTGYMKLAPVDTIRTLLGGGTAKENLILFDLRLPRIIISILIGAGLALSGCIIQGISRNALADPGLLGINAGASLMVILYTLFLSGKSFMNIFTLPFLALIGASLTAFIIYTFAYKRDEGIAPMRLILTGIAVQAGVSALTTVLVILLDENQYKFVANWQAGSIWGSHWNFVWAALPWFIGLLPYLILKSNILDILNLGDDVACGLGAMVEKERRKLLAVSVALAAICVSVGGNISFIGLLAPHLSKKLVGPKHRILLPTSALVGAVIVSISDTIGRVIIQPNEIPTGIVVAIIGAPYFLYLLIKKD